MNLICLVCAVVSANTILGFVSGLVRRFLPDRWWARLIAKVPGLGCALVYLYFAGYFIMDKDVNLVLAAAAGLAPLAISIVVKLARKVRFVDMD